MSNKSQTIWTAASFLVLGLIIGLLVTGPKLLTGENTAGNGSESAEEELDVVAVSVDDDPVLGNADAPVTIVEYSDYQCPWCEYWFVNTYPQIKSQYIDTGKVKMVYRDRPVTTHPQSQMAAEAAECVDEAGTDTDYYKMHDLLFSGLADWSSTSGSEDAMNKAKDIFIGYANSIGHDITACLESGAMTEEVSNDYTASRTYGVRGTPTFFINGKMVVGAQSFEYFEAIIEDELNQ